MKRKGYKSIRDFRGKLKDFDRTLAAKTATDDSDDTATTSSKKGGQSQGSEVRIWQFGFSLLLILVAVLLFRELQR